MSQAPNPNDATGMVKFVAIAIISFFLVVFGGCMACRSCGSGGSSGEVTWVCPKADCPGKKVGPKKAGFNCHGAMIPEADKPKPK